MLNKILLTLLVGVLAATYFGWRRRSKVPLRPAQAPPRLPHSPYLPPAPPRRWAHLLAGALALGIALTAGWRLWAHWSATARVVAVEVINTHTGETQRFRARQGDIAPGGNEFRTLDGRRVTLSGVDRLVVSEE
jgi:hypothetical protein